MGGVGWLLRTAMDYKVFSVSNMEVLMCPNSFLNQLHVKSFSVHVQILTTHSVMHNAIAFS